MIEAPREFSEQSGIPVEIPDRCRRCVTLARFALRYDELGVKISHAEGLGLSGGLPQYWADQIANMGDMSKEEATAFVSANEQRMRAEFVEKLGKLDKAREDQISFAQYVLDHCERGLVELTAIGQDITMSAEVCGSTTPERVSGVDGAEIVRVNRPRPA